MQHFLKRQSGFTLVEVLIVVVIVGILATFATVTLKSSRLKSRDVQRVAYINQINTALELYFLKNGFYPTAITAGQALSYNGVKYLDPVPYNPSPKNDGNCPNRDFVYTPAANNTTYSLTFCLSNAAGNFNKGLSTCNGSATCKDWLPNQVAGMLLWLKADSITLNNDDAISVWYDSSGNANHAIGLSTARPLFKTNVVNSKPVVRFDGSNDVMNFTSALSTIRTAIFVIKYTTGYLNYAPILGHASLYDWHGAPIDGNIVWTAYSNAYVQAATAYNNGTLTVATSIPRDITNFQVVEFLTTGNVNAGRLGNDRGGSWFKGDYAEVILYDNVLDASSRNKIETYIHEK